jgi:DDE family transposase
LVARGHTDAQIAGVEDVHFALEGCTGWMYVAGELTAAMAGQILLAWLKLLALDGSLARAEPKTLRYRVLHAAARLARGGRRCRLKIQASWPWAEAITAAWQRIDALPQAP